MTPIRRQYLKVKEAYPDAILLFRLGDFYETFEDDAVTVAELLDVEHAAGEVQTLPRDLEEAVLVAQVLLQHRRELDAVDRVPTGTCIS